MIKILPTLAKYWKIPLEKRKVYSVGEEISTSYPIKDNKEKLVSVLNLFKKNGVLIYYVPPKEIAEIKQDLLLRKTAAELLLKAAKNLPKGYIFKISEGYRPLWFQKLEFDKIFADFKKKNPKWSQKKVWEQTTIYIADPKLSPPHASGGTFDLTITTKEGKEIDMGTKLNSVNIKSNTFNKSFTKKQKDNRALLFETLTADGFVNIPSEWWHYSYGDQYWAIYFQKPFAIFGKVDIK